MARVAHETPEKIVIVAGPTFCEALKFTLLGVAIGAAVIHFMSREEDPTLAETDAVQAGLSGAGAKNSPSQSEKLSLLAGRIKDISGRALSLAHSASDAIKPTLEQAVAQGKLAAVEIEARLRKDVEEAGDKPFLAEKEDKAAAPTEAKFVE